MNRRMWWLRQKRADAPLTAAKRGSWCEAVKRARRAAKVPLAIPLIAAVLLLPAAPAQSALPGANGRIAFTSYRDGNAEIYVMDANGANQRRLTSNAAKDDEPAWSPGGTRLAFTSTRDGREEIYAMDADGANQTRLTSNTTWDLEPDWSPDGTRLAFTSYRDGNAEIYVMDANGANQRRLTSNAAVDHESAWSPDGTRLAFTSTRDGYEEIFVMDANGANQRRLTSTTAPNDEPAWSPDGTRLAFTSRRDLNAEIYVMDADGANQRRLTMPQDPPEPDEVSPGWSPDGTRIAFTRSGEIYVMDADGTRQTNLTNNARWADNQPDWSPHLAADTTPPEIDVALNPATPDGHDGWYRSDVSLTWSVVEPESPQWLVTTGCENRSITTDQPATSYPCAATSDGRTAGPLEVTIKRDATAPTVTVTGVRDGTQYVLGSVPAAGCSTTDATSGVRTAAAVSVTGGPVGTVTATCTGAADNAGNAAAPASVTYVVKDRACAGVAATIVGTPGNDTINGTAAADVIVAGDGNDTINGLDGNDIICGDYGNDRIKGGAGDDRYDAGAGVDTASFAASPAAVNANLTAGTAAGEGNDQLVEIENLIGSSFDDVLIGEFGANAIRGGNGKDVIAGSRGNDQLFGDLGADTFYSGPGDDEAFGGDGADTINGDDDNDRLFGEAGDDALLGYAGNDALDCGADFDRGNGGAESDTQVGCEVISEIP
jgi:dipeptidyl aminopeptidase/acylaminoacyl peptidase